MIYKEKRLGVHKLGAHTKGDVRDRRLYCRMHLCNTSDHQKEA